MSSTLAYSTESQRNVYRPMRRDDRAKLTATISCVWCRDPQSDHEPENPERELCRSHLAEYEGLSESELDRMEDEQRLDLL